MTTPDCPAPTSAGSPSASSTPADPFFADQFSADPLRRLVAVMDRLRSPGGCPWDADQTHASLVPYALEEAHELAEAVETGDRAGLREELGDLLLQVVFHARIAQEHPDEPFDLDDVAADLTAKLVRRHPHVFADAAAPVGTEGQHVAWDAIKKAEKRRESALDGVPHSLGALARTQKVLGRAGRAGLEVRSALDDSLGGRLFALVAQAQAEGLDAEGELRRTARAWEAAARTAEAERAQGAVDARGLADAQVAAAQDPVDARPTTAIPTTATSTPATPTPATPTPATPTPRRPA